MYMKAKTFDLIKEYLNPYRRHLVPLMPLVSTVLLKAFKLKSLWLSFFSFKQESALKFSIVSACYNVEEYLDDFLFSIQNQTLGFKKNIQLILVDDGSTDRTLDLMKKWEQKYPNNIIVLQQSNSGQSAARNLGLTKVKYEWVTFIDPDDFLHPESLKKIAKEITVTDIPLCMAVMNLIPFYEGKLGFIDNHPLNYRFESLVTVRQVKDLDDHIVMSASSAVVRRDVIKKHKLSFSEQCRPCFEDALFLNQYLSYCMEDSVIYMKEAKYFYRKRSNATSTLDKSTQDEKYYLNVFEQGYKSLIKHYEDTHRYMPLFIQKTLFYATYWYFKLLVNQEHNAYFLSDSQRAKFIKNIKEVYKAVTEESILDYRGPIDDYYRLGCLKLKDTRPRVSSIYVEKYDNIRREILLKYYLTNKDLEIKFKTTLGVELEITHEKLIEDSLFDSVFIYQKLVWVSLKQANGGKIQAVLDSTSVMFNILGELIPATDENNIRIKLGDSFSNKNSFWLLADRESFADDNAEHLYRYIMQNHPTQKVYFALSKKSSDWKRLKAEGFNLVSYGSLKYRRMLNQCACYISSHIDDIYVSKEIRQRTPYVFLQHGVTKDDLSLWLNQKKLSLIVTTTKGEYESFVKDGTKYLYTDKEVRLLGMPRYDYLYQFKDRAKKVILVMPTWRYSLKENNSRQDIKNSKYFKFWNSFLNSETLANLQRSYGYEVIFQPHPEMLSCIQEFTIPENVRLSLPGERSIQDQFIRASILITDYSSVAFDLAFLGREIIYYQFDAEEVFSKHCHTYVKGYFDYGIDGFGEVVKSEAHLLNSLEMVLKTNSIKNLEYHLRAKDSFIMVQGSSSKDLYDAISEMLEKKG